MSDTDPAAREVATLYSDEYLSSPDAIVYACCLRHSIKDEEFKAELKRDITAAITATRREAWDAACEKCAGECVDPQDAEDCRKLKMRTVENANSD